MGSTYVLMSHVHQNLHLSECAFRHYTILEDPRYPFQHNFGSVTGIG